MEPEIKGGRIERDNDGSFGEVDSVTGMKGTGRREMEQERDGLAFSGTE